MAASIGGGPQAVQPSLATSAGLSRRCRRLACGLTLILAACAPGPDLVGEANDRAPELRPLSLYRDGEATARLGELEHLASFALDAGDRRFGGFSSLALEGDRLLMLSDRGWLWRCRRRLDESGRLRGLEACRIDEVTLKAADGRFADAEALAGMADGRLVIGFEDGGAIARLAVAGDEVRVRPSGLPRLFEGAPVNAGLEAMAGLGDGRLLGLSEGHARGGGRLAAAIVDEAGTVPLAYRPAPGFKPTAADRLGRHLFVLERRASLLGGFEARIVLIDLEAEALAPGDVLEGRELARLGVGHEVDNFEGLLAEDGPGGAIHLTIIADDNFHAFQRTLLHQFRLKVPVTPAR